MDDSILSGELRLSAHLALPAAPARGLGLVLCHGFPNGPRGATTVSTTYPDLADRIARDSGFVVLTFNFRGAGISEGDFSVAGWRDDLRAAVRVLAARADVRAVWTAGFGHGGTVALCEAANDQLVRGVAVAAAPASLRAWAREPARLLAHAREMGMIRTPDYPLDPVAWGREVDTLDAITAAPRLRGRPLLVLHGVDDAEVSVAEARRMVDAAGPTAELRLVHGAGHRLRHDPRAIATLLGWLERQVPEARPAGSRVPEPSA